MYSSFFSWSLVRVLTAGGHGTSGDATQEDIVMGIIFMIALVHASHAPLDTIVQAGKKMMANEN